MRRLLGSESRGSVSGRGLKLLGAIVLRTILKEPLGSTASVPNGAVIST